MTDRPQPTPRSARTRRTVGRALGAAALLVVVLAATGCVPLVSPATSGRQYGRGPVDAVWDAADAQPKCAGLTSAELAAMMMVPTYPETGGTVPSPMTLSRWDNVSVWSLNANLFAFGQTSGPYVNAFFSPGIGMWQFDSAGGWPMTAADAIDSVTSARQAAQTISYRYCNAPSSVPRDDVSLRRYAWGPWFGCSSSSNTNCETIYSQLYANELLNLAPDETVGRFGGMEQRTCDLAGVGTGVVCWYVDPGRAQGSTGWRAGTYDPARSNWVTPLPKPFYVVSAGGQEYRVWLQDDTGFDTGITASKPITANARTSLTWSRAANLCDRTAGRGACGPTAPPPPPPPPPLPSAASGSAYSVYLRNTPTTGVADRTVTFGPTRPAQILMCDWDGDGVATPGSFAGGVWTISNRPDGGDAKTFVYGNASGDTAVCGDWDGNGTQTPGVKRGAYWYLSNTLGAAAANQTIAYGNPGDLPVVGDWNGDGRDTVSVVRNGWWYLSSNPASGRADMSFPYGNSTGDVPVVGDWDGNGRDEPGVFRDGWWYLSSAAGQGTAAKVFAYGGPGDVPLAGRWTAATPSGPAVVR